MLAIGVTVLMVATLWLGVIAPLLQYDAELSATRALRQALAMRMQAAVDSIPALQREVAAEHASGPTAPALIPGVSDAVAAAALQEQVQDMARGAGITINSAEALTTQVPSDKAGGSRRISVHLALTGRWARLLAFLQAVDRATPRMLMDDLQMQPQAVLFGAEKPLDVSLTVFGFRAASP